MRACVSLDMYAALLNPTSRVRLSSLPILQFLHGRRILHETGTGFILCGEQVDVWNEVDWSGRQWRTVFESRCKRWKECIRGGSSDGTGCGNDDVIVEGEDEKLLRCEPWYVLRKQRERCAQLLRVLEAGIERGGRRMPSPEIQRLGEGHVHRRQRQKEIPSLHLAPEIQVSPMNTIMYCIHVTTNNILWIQHYITHFNMSVHDKYWNTVSLPIGHFL